jgi:hypothetical protein
VVAVAVLKVLLKVVVVVALVDSVQLQVLL